MKTAKLQRRSRSFNDIQTIVDRGVELMTCTKTGTRDADPLLDIHTSTRSEPRLASAFSSKDSTVKTVERGAQTRCCK